MTITRDVVIIYVLNFDLVVVCHVVLDGYYGQSKNFDSESENEANANQ